MDRRWWFKEHRHPEPPRWTWRALRPDNSIDRMSSRELKDYGAAVMDAMNNGFRPAQDYWVVEGASHTTHFRQGEPAVIVPTAADTSDTRPPGAMLPPLKARPSKQ